MDNKFPNLTLDKGRYTCPVCGSDGPRFKSLGEKRAHLRSQHPKNARS